MVPKPDRTPPSSPTNTGQPIPTIRKLFIIRSGIALLPGVDGITDSGWRRVCCRWAPKGWCGSGSRGRVIRTRKSGEIAGSSGVTIAAGGRRIAPLDTCRSVSTAGTCLHQQVMESLTAQCSASDRTASLTGAYNELYPVVCVLKHNYN